MIITFALSFWLKMISGIMRKILYNYLFELVINSFYFASKRCNSFINEVKQTKHIEEKQSSL